MPPLPGLTPPKPIPLKDRSSLIFVEPGQLDVIDGTFVVVDATGMRLLIRDAFRREKLLGRLIPTIEDVLAAGGLEPPQAPPEAQPPAIAETPSGDQGHRG
ncbi:hypothetical protein [Roseospirillum parvum]|uniref:Uncharacterized protein n=1 Tax=Roseospirillum parvum TaxID=83401 RepID=A0A1G8ED59_9PROT|nr:hypothetical protein SAMN05421742_1102 [Roseospirillum parvum]